MGEEILGRAEMDEDGLGAAGAADSADGNDAWRRGFRDPENWHDLAERGTPRNG
jgi:hypothetical protein